MSTNPEQRLESESENICFLRGPGRRRTWCSPRSRWVTRCRGSTPPSSSSPASSWSPRSASTSGRPPGTREHRESRDTWVTLTLVHVCCVAGALHVSLHRLHPLPLLRLLLRVAGEGAGRGRGPVPGRDGELHQADGQNRGH